MTTESTIALSLSKQDVEILQEAIKDPVASIRSLVMNDLSMFIRYFWDTYSQEKFIMNWHIEEICKELEEVARRVGNKEKKLYDLIFNVPPGTTKTAMVSIFWPVWCWTNWYWFRFITSSHSNDLSLESAEYSREIIRSEKFKQIFPELSIKVDKESKSNFRITKKEGGKLLIGGNRFSTSVGAKATGFHAHILIPDDLMDPQAAISKAKIDAANLHVDQTLLTRKVDKNVTTMVMICQRLSPNDPPQHLLDKGKKNIRHISLPGEIKGYLEYLKPIEYEKYYVDGLLDPVRMNWDVLDEMMEDLGQYGYHGQVGQNPILAGGGMFETDHLITIQTPPIAHHVLKTVRYWDKAGTEGGGAYTVGVKMCRLQDGRFILLDVIRGQWSSAKREKVIRETAIADGQACIVYIEQEPGSGGKESAEGTVLNLAGFSVHKDRPTGDKVYRADPYSVQVNGGNVNMLTGIWNEKYVDELKNFPNSQYKDQTDASSGAFHQLVSKKQVKVHSRG